MKKILLGNERSWNGILTEKLLLATNLKAFIEKMLVDYVENADDSRRILKNKNNFRKHDI